MGRVEIKGLLGCILRDAKEEMRKFNRNTYADQMDRLFESHVYTLMEVEKLYHLENDNLEVLKYLADGFSEYAYCEMEGMKKRKKEVAMIDFNMAMVSFVLPMIEKRYERFMSVFADKCVLSWNMKFPKYKIAKANQEMIQGGFKSKLCYITTAVCENMNKADDCYELNLLREYRDDYLMNEAEDGQDLISQYYDIAPTIVKRIDKEEQSAAIYQGIWEEYLQPCIRLIEGDCKGETKELYSSMVRDLSNKYVY